MVMEYKTELNENRHNVLVEKEGHECPEGPLATPEAAVRFMQAVFHPGCQAEEYVYMVALDRKSRPLGVFEVSHGSAWGSLCEPREIFIKALLCGASGIILAHNHTSGDITPSKEDTAVYWRVKQAGELLGVPLVDSLIIGSGYYSFQEAQGEVAGHGCN